MELKINIIILTALFLFIPRVSAQIPYFRIGLADSTYYSIKDIDTNSPAIFFYFSPSCHECEKVTEMILNNAESLKRYQIIMITNESLAEVIQYSKKHGLSEYPAIKVGTEGFTNIFLSNFPVSKLPFLVIYDDAMFEKEELLLSVDKIQNFLSTQ